MASTKKEPAVTKEEKDPVQQNNNPSSKEDADGAFSGSKTEKETTGEEPGDEGIIWDEPTKPGSE